MRKPKTASMRWPPSSFSPPSASCWHGGADHAQDHAIQDPAAGRTLQQQRQHKRQDDLDAERLAAAKPAKAACRDDPTQPAPACNGVTMSQADQILDMLQRGPVTAMDALTEVGCFRLAARINDLRRDGHDIVTTTIETNGGKHIAQYTLKEPQNGR